ncbi:choice-of-anchor M domain-containing protein [Corynebacterium sp. HMSC074A09]|uniref:choice-of-anchor M domain-containing protein n=1 Tax=Corynebacterium sp. HMSC074A09 TaxID=1739311 RepID=UPI0008A140B9|nr:choice-of-anchor M domain-containing protein [Corynebacterium sp. HMSC074A09]OFK66705.1 cell surface protein [Corynebacterium sp. HMSC074A09]
MHRTTELHRVTAALCAIAVALAVVFTGHPAPARADGEVFVTGHVDAFYVSAPGGELTLSMKEDITGSGVVRPGNDVTLKVAEEAWSEATEGIDGIGAPTYYLPQTQDSSLLWPGWDTQSAQSAGYTDINFEFVEVTGPGDIFVFETAGFGDIQPVTDAGALDLVSGDVINQAYPAHRHVNWAFSEPGIYTMTVQAESNGDTSNQVTYTWDVGDAEATPREEETDTDHGAESSAELDDVTLGEASSDEPASSNSGSRSGGGSSGGATRGAASAAGTKAAEQQAQDKNRKDRSERKERKERKPARVADKTTPAAENVDTVAAAGYYDSGQNLLPWGIGILGLGMLVLGLALARLALIKGRD